MTKTKQIALVGGVVVGMWAGLGACALSPVTRELPLPAAPSSRATCPAGEVVVVDGATVGCDMVGGVNTLAIEWPGADAGDEAHYQALADDAGCARTEVRWTHGFGTFTGVDCDF